MSRLIHGDSLEVLATLEPESIDAVVTDPPYGLEFMGAEWDRFREDDRDVRGYNGRAAGAQGGAARDDDRTPQSRSGVEIGGTKRASTSRCQGCGKRDQFRKPHDCPDGTPWRKELIDPHAAPPSAVAFQAWCREWSRLVYRALKPGGHMLAFGGTRMAHRLVSGVEDAGFEIRDTIAWLYGSGFPKGLNVAEALAALEVDPDDEDAARRLIDAVRAYAGWNVALKPAHEPIVVARKPLAGTVAGNVLAHGTGALNIAGCKIAHANADDLATSKAKNPGRSDLVTSGVYGADRPQQRVDDAGRWPANVVLDEAAAEMLDAQTGELISGDRNIRRESGSDRNGNRGPAYGAESRPAGTPMISYGDSGGASRFLYVAKATTAERNAGLAVAKAGMSLFTPHDAPDGNDHPTVKPVDLMRWLVRLVTPPGGVVLDPFMGSGTTGIAAHLEQVDFVGIEREPSTPDGPDFYGIARARLAHWTSGHA